MGTDFFALASFAVITTFTPGPNNITSASMDILFGYRDTLKYMLGIASGFFLVMLLCGWVSAALLQALPVLQDVLRIAGVLYILWLAYHTLRASYAFDEEEQPAKLGFRAGFILQLLNPKVIVYGLMMYSAFLSGLGVTPVAQLAAALALAGLGFCSVSTWALFGAAMRAYLNRPYARQIVNTALSLLLIYTAIELSGIVGFLFS